MTALPLASVDTVRPGDRLLLVAAADDATSTMTAGTALVRTSQLQTNIPISRNARGGPVLDAGGRVVATHDANSGEGTLSFERAADFISAGLPDVVAGRTPPASLLGVGTKVGRREETSRGDGRGRGRAAAPDPHPPSLDLCSKSRPAWPPATTASPPPPSPSWARPTRAASPKSPSSPTSPPGRHRSTC